MRGTIIALLGALFVVSSLTIFTYANAQGVSGDLLSGEIYFVASQEELGHASGIKNDLGGLAVFIGFYQGQEENRMILEELIEAVRARPLHPVFLYGEVTEIFVRRLLAPDFPAGFRRCEPLTFVGMVRLPPENGSGGNDEEYMKICGSMYDEVSESLLRVLIKEWWDREKSGKGHLIPYLRSVEEEKGEQQ